ncbi:Long-chain-fatty-acid--CoA ligase 6 [Bagarius yarrelli]|uniref:long-chain-fatty-acid--CoA ligase n=1 Tax=Bagarius yarrelli TaxID=175774 RepID=A0A556VAU0_BAGYA|nr:Long-chain-fatty-acid--CoA ligase 6 [Bagarius yarrelli]
MTQRSKWSEGTLDDPVSSHRSHTHMNAPKAGDTAEVHKQSVGCIVGSITLIEKMQEQEQVLNPWLSELEKLFHLIYSTPPAVLFGLGALTAMAYWLATRPRALMPPCDLCHQSEEVAGGGHRSMLVENTKLLSRYHEDTKTLYEAFQRGLHITGDGPFLGSRLPNQPYKWISYHEVSVQKVKTRAEHLGSGLVFQGCQPNSNQFIGVFAQNRPEKARVLLDNVERQKTLTLKKIILMDPFDIDLEERGKKCDVHIQALKDVEMILKLRQKHYRKENSHNGIAKGLLAGTVVGLYSFADEWGVETVPAAGDLKKEDRSQSGPVTFTIRTRHLKNIPLEGGEKVISPNQDDVLISFLPLAHMFERLIEAVVYCHGGRIGFFQGDIRLLSDDMKALRPTVFPVVPRLLNRMYDKIFSQANTPVKRWLLNFAAKKKGEEVSSGIIRNDSIWDKIFFSKIQANLGGRLRMVITGAAPTSPTVLSFLRAALGCQVYEAYGQTECTAGCTFTTPGDWTSGHVGAPLPCNLIKLVDVPEKNYFTSKGKGEVCVKGPNVFKGYLKDPVMTAETLDLEGWLHTGDIGEWLPNGTLKIIDRKKHIFKLAQGEYISPEKIENIYIRSEPVSQLYVHGDSLQSCLVGIVVPDPEVMPSWAKKRGIVGCYGDLCENVELKKAILDDMLCLGKASGLHSFEQVKDIHVHNEMFSIENGLLTPTLKAKRPELKEYFKQQIEHLYDKITM